MLTVVKEHCLQLGCQHLLSCNFKWFNIRLATVHHSLIQEKVDELIAKGAIELSTGRAGFYSNVYVVPKHTHSL